MTAPPPLAARACGYGWLHRVSVLGARQGTLKGEGVCAFAMDFCELRFMGMGFFGPWVGDVGCVELSKHLRDGSGRGWIIE